MLSRIPLSTEQRQVLLAGMVGLWAVLVLMKLGNPVVLDQQVSAPGNLIELLVASWPVDWGFALTLPVAALGLAWAYRAGRLQLPWWLPTLPAAWLVWQMAAAFRTTDPRLTIITLKHFGAIVVLFYLGLLVLSRLTPLRLFWLGLITGFVAIMVVGWRQHFGGLEETRRYFFSLQDWRRFPPEFIQKLSSDRIYATLFYPNALAGLIILLLPPVLGAIWQADSAVHPGTRWVGLALAAGLGLGCLYWSGSKGGWLIVLSQGLGALLFTRIRFKALLLAVVLILGGAGFWIKYQPYFSKGATSVSARLDYWKVALRNAAEHPLFGSGPGTFGMVYARLKPPDAEMSRLAHNDYLQQLSDSGWPAMLLYLAWWSGGLLLGCPKPIHRAGNPRPTKTFSAIHLGTWLGLIGLAVQGVTEFWLYIPALAWVAFLLLGWTVGVNGGGEPMGHIGSTKKHGLS